VIADYDGVKTILDESGLLRLKSERS